MEVRGFFFVEPPENNMQFWIFSILKGSNIERCEWHYIKSEMKDFFVADVYAVRARP